METTWHVGQGLSLECEVLDELPSQKALVINVTDERAKGSLKKFAGKRTVRAYQVYGYKPQHETITVGYDGRKLHDPKTLKDLGDGPEKPGANTGNGNGQDVTVTTIEE